MSKVEFSTEYSEHCGVRGSDRCIRVSFLMDKHFVTGSEQEMFRFGGREKSHNEKDTFLLRVVPVGENLYGDKQLHFSLSIPKTSEWKATADAYKNTTLILRTWKWSQTGDSQEMYD
jgi:hypothetical protein